MFGNSPIGDLPIGDVSGGPANVVVRPETLEIEVTLNQPIVKIDVVIQPETLEIEVTLNQPVVKIDAVVQPETIEVEATLNQPVVITRLPASWFRERAHAVAAYLVEITPVNGGGTLYFSHRTLQDEASPLYENYIADISGLGEELRRSEAAGRNAEVRIEFRNDPWGQYDRLIERGESYPFEGADVVIKEVYLDAQGRFSQPEVLFRGDLDQPEGIDLVKFVCMASSKIYTADRRWKQAVVDEDTYPDAHEDLGKVIPIIYGAPGKVPALRTAWGARSTLIAEISATQNTAELSDGSRFPSGGYAYIEDEKVYFNRSGNVLTITRGVGGTTAAIHRRGAQVWEALSYYDSVLADHALASVGPVYAVIGGELLRVASGVSTFVDGAGRQVLRASEQVRLEAVNDNVAIQDSLGVNDDIAISGRVATKTVFPSWGWGDGTNPDAMADGNEGTFNSFGGGSFQETAKVTFANNTYLGAIRRQYYHVLGFGSFTVKGRNFYLNEPGWVRVEEQYGAWNDNLYIQNVSQGTGQPWSTPKIYEVRKEVEYDPGQLPKTGQAYRTGAISLTGGVTATRNVERFHAEVAGYADPTGEFGGAGSLIERPDNAIRHFLRVRLVAGQDEVDASSFSSAGAAMAAAVAGGYKFAFVLDRKIKPSAQLRAMAHQSRSALRYDAGRWRLDFITDAAPAAKKTIGAGELAGKGAMFTFSRTPIVDLANSITARYARNHSAMNGESEWDGTLELSHAGSMAVYGEWPEELDLDLIKDTDTAQDVLDHMLDERRGQLLVVEFPVFFEHFDLEPGDTFEIDNPLWGGKRFFIEEVRRADMMRATVRGLEWRG